MTPYFIIIITFKYRFFTTFLIVALNFLALVSDQHIAIIDFIWTQMLSLLKVFKKLIERKIIFKD